MPDPTTDPGGNPGGAPNPAPAPAPQPEPIPEKVDNAAFARLRTEAAQAKTRADELESRLKEIERAEMDEKTRLQAELDDAQKAAGDAEKLRNQLGQFTTKLEAEYETAVAALPEDKREAVKALTLHVPLEERLAAVRSAATLIGAPPTSAGTKTNPGTGVPPAPGAPDPAKPLEVKDIDRMSFAEALKASPIMQQTRAVFDNGVAEMRQQMADMQKQIQQLAQAKT